MRHSDWVGPVDWNSDMLLDGNWVRLGHRHGIGTVYWYRDCHLKIPEV